MRKLIAVVLLLSIASLTVVAAEPGFFTRLSYLFSGNEQTLLPDASQAPDAVPFCNACSAIVCGTDEQFLCTDALDACEDQYNDCKIVRCLSEEPEPTMEGCSWNGKEYDDGESFKNDCNTCTCTNGNIACTLMACPDDIPGGDECTTDADCGVNMCVTEPCPQDKCINGNCVTQTISCHGVGRWCTEMGNECCAGLTCDVDVRNPLSGGNYRGVCVRAEQPQESVCGNGICEMGEEQTCPPCDSSTELCPGVPCIPDDQLCPQDCP